MITIHLDVIKKFTEWNTHVLCNDLFYDKKMVQVLLVIVVGTENIACGRVSERAMRFVKGDLMCLLQTKNIIHFINSKNIPEFLKMRARNDDARLSKAEEYKENIISQKRRAVLKTK